MNRLLLAASLLLLTACSSPPKIPAAGIEQIRASLRSDQGKLRYSSVAIWMPNSRDFNFVAVEPSVPGVAVLTDTAMLFQAWGGANGATTLRQIPLASIEDVSLITFGRSARLVVRSKDGAFDSFAASDGEGQISMRDETEVMHKALTDIISSRAATIH